MISRKTSTIMRSFVITALFLLFTNGAGAAPVEEWNRTFLGANGSVAFFVAQTPDQGYIIAGSTYYSRYHEDAWLIKTDFEGQLQWNRTYVGKRIRKVSITQDGGYILRGSNDWDFWLMKTDATGQEQWSRTLSGKNNTFFASIEETSDGGSIIATVEDMSLSENKFTWNSRFIKVDASGNEQWNVTSKRLQDFFLNSVKQTKDGGYILSGTTIPQENYYSYYYVNCDAVIIKTDASGNIQWEKILGWWGEREGASSVVQTMDGGYMIEGFNGGFSLFPRYDENYLWLIKTDASGKPLYRTYSPSRNFQSLHF